jgi:hypothetical protein
VRAGGLQVVPQGVGTRFGKRNPALLPALAEDLDGPRTQIQLIHVKSAQLGDPESGAIEEFQNRTIPHPFRGVLRWQFTEESRFFLPQHFGKGTVEPRSLEILGWG